MMYFLRRHLFKVYQISSDCKCFITFESKKKEVYASFSVKIEEKREKER